MQRKLNTSVQKVLVYLRLDNLPGIFTFVSLLGYVDESNVGSPKAHHTHEEKDNQTTSEAKPNRPVEVQAIRLVELTDRDSSVMKVSEVHDYSFSDPILNTFRTFGQLNRVAVSGGVVMAPEHAYAETLVSRARDFSSDLFLIPWSETGGMSESQIPLLDDKSQKFATGPHSSFVSSVLKNSKGNIGIFINKGFGGPELSRPRPGHLSRTTSGSSVYRANDLAMAPMADQGHHIFFPYFGGSDDQFALRLVLQLAKNTTITATIARVYIQSDSLESSPSSDKQTASASATPEASTSYTVPGTPEDKEASDTFYTSIRDSLPAELSSRVVFQSIQLSSNDIVPVTLETARQDLAKSKSSTGDLVIVGRNSVSLSAGSSPSSAEIGSEARKALGILGEVMAGKSQGVQASVMVVQAGPEA